MGGTVSAARTRSDRVAHVVGSATQRSLESVLLDMALASPDVQVPVRDNIYNCGDHDESIYFLVRGMVKSMAWSRGGKRCMLAIHSRGEFFGEVGLLGTPRPDTAIAMKPSVVRRVPKARLIASLRGGDVFDDFSLRLIGRIAERQRVIINMATMKCENRLAVTLLELARKMGTRQERGLVMECITHEDLGLMIGTTRSRIGFFLKTFRDTGLVDLNGDGTMVIHERRMLAYLAQEV